MLTRKELINHIRSKGSFLCVGLDPDKEKVPAQFLEQTDWIFEFNKYIIEQVAEYCVAFKPNTAFYESYGTEGWRQFEATVNYIRTNYPKHFVIADAKRGDIGNTSKRYATAFFEHLDCHAVTVAPYMGEDSVSPFLGFEGKWVIVLGLTSNPGSRDFQHHGTRPLYLDVIEKTISWGGIEQVMIVAGATRGEDLRRVREAAGDAFLLVPGVGAQGGKLKDVVEHAMLHDDIGLLVNSSRGIIYSESPKDVAKTLSDEMASLIK